MLRRILVYVLGAGAGLLLGRLIVRLFSGRPDNPAFALLLAITEPMRAPLAFLDGGQPRFGAALEYSTLAMLVVLPALALVAWRVLPREDEVRAGYR